MTAYENLITVVFLFYFGLKAWKKRENNKKNGNENSKCVILKIHYRPKKVVRPWPYRPYRRRRPCNTSTFWQLIMHLMLHTNNKLPNIQQCGIMHAKFSKLNSFCAVRTISIGYYVSRVPRPCAWRANRGQLGRKRYRGD